MLVFDEASIITKTNLNNFSEMAKMRPSQIGDLVPENLYNRVIDLFGVVDEWFWEGTGDTISLERVGVEHSYIYNLGKKLSERRAVRCHYGFIRPYKYQRQGRATGAETNIQWKFCALHAFLEDGNKRLSYGKSGFADDDFETLYKELTSIDDFNEVKERFIDKNGLRPYTGSILNLCKR